jgi:predicted transcriptional regulator of viral defense system
MFCYTADMSPSKMKKLLEMLARQHIVRPRDLQRARIPRNYLSRLVRRGEVQKLDRGTYTAGKVPASEHITLLETNKKIPKGVICLLSALSFHQIGTQLPHEVWIAIDVKAWTPRITSPTVRIMRFSGAALHFGVQERQVMGGKIRVFSPAKTVADCFKFRNKIGLDVAIEALRECFREKKASIRDLFEAAKVCRVERVMRPYLESLP